MKNKLLFLFAVIFSLSVQAQERSEKEIKKHAEKVKKSLEKGKNIRSLDTLFASGKPYCLMKVTKNTIFGPIAFSVCPLKKPDQEEIYLESWSVGAGSSAQYFWDMAFVRQGQKISFKHGAMDLENTIVDYKLFTDSSLNVVGMNKLVLLKGGPRVSMPPVPGNAPGSSNPALVNRNRNAMVQVFGDNIMQGGITIGSITQISATDAGKLFYQITIKLPTGELIATAKTESVTDHNWYIITAKDNKEHIVSSSLGADKEDIAKYLVDKLYL